MKLLKPKKIPGKIVKFIFMAYKWGYTDAEKGLPMKTQEEVKSSIQGGYSRGIEKSKH